MSYAVGIDCSKWQGVIDWQAVKDQGVTWACARIGIGWGYTDPQWAANLEGAHAVGLPMGGYWVPSFPSGASDSINGLENALEESNEKPDFMVCDVEKFHAGASRNATRDHIWALSNWMRAYLSFDRVWQYTRANLWNEQVGDGVMAKDPGPSHNLPSDYPLWIAHYRAAPGQDWRQYLNPGNMPKIPSAWVPSLDRARGDWTGWNVWQMIDSAKNFQGVQSNEIDINVMKMDFFNTYFGDVVPEPDPVPPVDPPVNGEPWGVIYRS